jgi:hypothetical protein
MGWDTDSLGPPVSRVEVELYTAGHRVSGHMSTRFRRVGDILNLSSSTHLVVEGATVLQYANPGAPRIGESVMVSLDTVLFGISSGIDDRPDEALIVQKRPVKIELALNPFWLSGTVHVPAGSHATDVLNVADRFMPLTDVEVTSAGFPAVNRDAPILAVQRNLAEILVVTDTEGAWASGGDFPTEVQSSEWQRPAEWEQTGEGSGAEPDSEQPA